jgi:hypothetical protein
VQAEQVEPCGSSRERPGSTRERDVASANERPGRRLGARDVVAEQPARSDGSGKAEEASAEEVGSCEAEIRSAVHEWLLPS